jgi:hypothetical protein
VIYYKIGFKLRKTAVFVGILYIFLFCACEGMRPILPLNRMYEVSARGESLSLDEYALIKQGESIQPYFVQSIRGDPDVIGLGVTLNAADGTRAGGQILYLLGSAEGTDIDGNGSAGNPRTSILMERMDSTFPRFSMPLDLEPGPYVMSFQVYGKRGAQISKTDKNIYYLAGEDYNISQISVHLPGIVSPSHLIPQGTVVLLNAAIIAGEALDPYIAWYNGRICIAEGRVSQGANQILWKTPSNTSFQNIRAEVVPFPPLHNDYRTAAASGRPDRMLLGKSREISLAVSSAGVFAGPLPGFLDYVETNHQGIILKDYQFSGTLSDSKNPQIVNALRRIEDEGDSPCWLPLNEIYGLGLGPRNIYELPSFSLDTVNRRLLFVLDFGSLNEGTLFSIGFKNQGVAIILSREEELILTLVSETQKEQIPLKIPLKDSFITLLLDLTLRQNSLFLTIGTNGNLIPQTEKVIALSNSQSLEGIFQLGGNDGVFPVMILNDLVMASLNHSDSVVFNDQK